MTKEEQKADELIENVYTISNGLIGKITFGFAVALAADKVDLLINTLDEIGKSERLEFWQSVKQHILNKA